MKFATRILITSILLAGVFGFSHHADWILFKTTDYSIQFPQKPDTSSQLVPSQIGDLKMDIVMYDASKANEDNLVYGVITTLYPDSLVNSDKKEKLASFFRASIDGAIKNVGGQLLSEKEVELNGFPGREIRTSIQQAQGILKMQLFLVHNQMFILQVISETAKEKNASAARFFNSFALLKK